MTPATNPSLLCASDINLCWNISNNLAVCDFVVIHDPDINLNLWTCCRGKWNIGWMGDNRGAPTAVVEEFNSMGFTNTPTEVFGELMFTTRFENDFEHRRAIKELAIIQECEWAREMSRYWRLDYPKYVTKNERELIDG